MRVCLVYDCLFPYTVGGAERWYRNLAERLAADGHEVRYLTLRQWERGAVPVVAGVDVHAVGPRMRLYAESGRRRTLPPIVFGVGVLWHLIRHGHRYDVVHTCSFPYFSLLAAALLRRRAADIGWWWIGLRSGPAVTGATTWGGSAATSAGSFSDCCALVPQRAFCFSRLYAARLRDEGLRGTVTVLAGVYDGPLAVRITSNTEPMVLFAGRHIPEKRAAAIVPAIARVRTTLPEARAAIVGDGPERPEVLRLVAELGLRESVYVPGFVATETVDELMGRAMCMVLPSRREGYGLVVIEAAARGTPSVVVEGPDNAAVELIADDVNGVVAASASAEDLAAAILRIHEAGPRLRRSTADWFAANARRLSLQSSLEAVADSYQGLSHPPGPVR